MSVDPPRPVTLLIDEDLSAKVAARLQDERGIDAVHLRDRGKTGLRDDQVFQLAFDEDRVLVTANVHDFIKLAKGGEVHGGVVFVHDGELKRDEQYDLLLKVVDALEAEYAQGRDLINRVLHVERRGTLSIEEMPPSSQ